MIRWISIFMAGLIAAQSFHISLNDVLSFDDLMEHARYHQETYGDDFFSFASKHYGSEQDNHMNKNHKDEHQDLPFQHASTHVFCPIALLSHTDYHFYLPEKKPVTKDSFFRSFHNTLLVIKTFQPPRNI